MGEAVWQKRFTQLMGAATESSRSPDVRPTNQSRLEEIGSVLLLGSMGSHCTVPFARVVLGQCPTSLGMLLCPPARLRCLSPGKAHSMLFAEEPVPALAVGLPGAPAVAAEQALWGQAVLLRSAPSGLGRG